MEKGQIRYSTHSLTEDIHNHGLQQAVYTDDSIFATNSEILLNKYSIDKPFLDKYLRFLDTIVNKRIQNLSVKDQKRAFTFLNVYNINFELLYNKYKTSEYRDIVLDLINYALDFDVEGEDMNNHNNLNQRITDLYLQAKGKEDLSLLQKNSQEQSKSKSKSKSSGLYFWTMYNSITGYRRALIGTISQAIFYSYFESFLIPSFFDFRGRKYHKGIHLNPQSYSFVKAILKPYDTLHKIPSEVLYEIAMGHIKDDGVKRRLQEIGPKVLSPENLKKKIEEYFSSFISQEHKEGFLDRYRKETERERERESSVEPFSPIFQKEGETSETREGEDFLDWYNYICSCIKDKGKALMITSYILLEKRLLYDNSVCYANAYSYDATNSGYQMLAMLFKSKSLGHLCNLTGIEKQDLYQDIDNKFVNAYENAFTALDHFLNEMFSISWKEFKTLLSLSLSLSLETKDSVLLNQKIDRICALVSAETKGGGESELNKKLMLEILSKKDLKNVSEFMTSKINLWILGDVNMKEKFDAYFTFCKGIYWISSKQADRFLYPVKANISLYSFFCFYEIIRLRYILDCHPWVDAALKKRDLFKRSVMTLIYGGSFTSRKENIQDYLIQTSVTLGESPLDAKTLNNLVFYVESYFREYYPLVLSEFDNLKTVAKILTENEKESKGIMIINNNFIIDQTFIKYESNKQRIYVRTIKGKQPYRLSLQGPIIIDNNFKEISHCKLSDLHLMYDIAEIRSHFPPNFIHSGDGFIIHDLMGTHLALNQSLHPYECTLVTNHDNFSLGRTLYTVLPYFVEDSYKNFYNYDYLKTLKSNVTPSQYLKIQDLCNKPGTENYLDGTFGNPHFIKMG